MYIMNDLGLSIKIFYMKNWAIHFIVSKQITKVTTNLTHKNKKRFMIAMYQLKAVGILLKKQTGRFLMDETDSAFNYPSRNGHSESFR